MSNPEKVDFNEYAEDYEKILEDDLKFFGEENGYFAEYKVKIVKDNSNEQTPLRILEYGCGIGLNLRYFKKYFPDSELSGCDISEKSINIASQNNPGINLFTISEVSLQQRTESFDLIFVSCVFHHIAPELRNDSIKKIKNLLKTGGELYIFEHNPFNPVTRKIVKDCIWDKDAILLKPSETISLMENAGLKITEKKFTLFFPAQLNFLRPVEKILGNIPMGGQYYIRGIKE